MPDGVPDGVPDTMSEDIWTRWLREFGPAWGVKADLYERPGQEQMNLGRPVPASWCGDQPYTYQPEPVLTAKPWLPAGREVSWKRGIWA